PPSANVIVVDPVYHTGNRGELGTESQAVHRFGSASDGWLPGRVRERAAGPVQELASLGGRRRGGRRGAPT
ncbi:MAG TPA: hypothetical protein VIJ15_10235, partial [Dermatophilaceae bacterium]